MSQRRSRFGAMWMTRVCPGCGVRGWAPCPACAACLQVASAVEVSGARSAEALVDYTGVAVELVHHLKFGGGKDVGRWFGAAMATRIRADIDIVTWLPTTRERRRERGYDQAEVLARAAGAAARWPAVRRCLRRVDRSGHQTGLSANDRQIGPRFVAIAELADRRILLVDDVVTTSTSARNGVETLLKAGARSVDVMVIARTPAPSERQIPGARVSRAT